MPIDLGRLSQAVASRVREQGGVLTKTKLLKYLYLFDIAAYRRNGTTLTGLSWIFYKFGPWAAEFEPAYDKWQGVFINVRNSGDAQIVLPQDRLDLERVVEDVGLQMDFGRIVDEWAGASLGEMLNYVYFDTEPMQVAQREANLDFSTVTRDAARQLKRLPVRDANPTDIAAARQRIEAAKRARPRTVASLLPLPVYDEVYWDARAAFDDDYVS